MKVIFVGKTSGKVSKVFINRLLTFKTEHQVEFFNTLKEFHANLRMIVNSPSVIVPVFCEDYDLKGREYYANLAYEIEIIASIFGNMYVLHPYWVGVVLGNKIESNKFFTGGGVLMPRLFLKDGEGEIFVNNISGSCTDSQTTSGKYVEGMYNTSLIDTVFEYGGDKFYVCPRTMCVGGEICEVYLRFRNVKDRNPNVHGSDTPMLPDLHNTFYRERIIPNYDKLVSSCNRIGHLLGLGFYAHDFLLGPDNNFYLCESSIKLDNIKWKKMSCSITDELIFEVSLEDSIDRSLESFFRQVSQRYGA